MRPQENTRKNKQADTIVSRFEIEKRGIQKKRLRRKKVKLNALFWAKVEGGDAAAGR